MSYLYVNASGMPRNLYSEGRKQWNSFMPKVFSNKLPFCLGHGLSRVSYENIGCSISVLIAKTGSHSILPSSPASKAEDGLKTLCVGSV